MEKNLKKYIYIYIYVVHVQLNHCGTPETLLNKSTTFQLKKIMIKTKYLRNELGGSAGKEPAMQETWV